MTDQDGSAGSASIATAMAEQTPANVNLQQTGGGDNTMGDQSNGNGATAQSGSAALTRQRTTQARGYGAGEDTIEQDAATESSSAAALRRSSSVRRRSTARPSCRRRRRQPAGPPDQRQRERRGVGELRAVRHPARGSAHPAGRADDVDVDRRADRRAGRTAGSVRPRADNVSAQTTPSGDNHTGDQTMANAVRGSS